MFQERHHGILIPKEEQPQCKCGSGMSLSIGYPNDKCVAFWYCLDANNCPEEFEQVSFADWISSYPVSDEIREHFETVGLDYSDLQAQELEVAGLKRVGGHIWGGGFWGKAEGKKAWTGYKGQSMEYWE